MANGTARIGGNFGYSKRTLATTLACAALFSGTLFGVVGFNSNIAQATPSAVETAKAELEKLEAENSRIAEDYTASSQKLKESEAAKIQAAADLELQNSKAESVRATLGNVVQTTQQNSSINITLRMLASESTEDFLGQVATMQSVSALTAERVARFESERSRLEELKVTLAKAVESITEETAKQKELLAQYEEKENKAKAVLARLTADDRASIDAARAAKEREAAAALNFSSGVAPNERTGIALNFALAQLGKPYLWGGTGPNGYDCSGLTFAAYRAAGVSIPRTSGSQFGAGTSVAVGDLQPGDLVFYYSGISHVGMYIGNGQIVHSVTPGVNIRISGLFSAPYMGARRYI